ncbi:hypothetical protein FOCG_18230 [Fusarium oxysporum f. sp. radicis-lycopersici 26381]|nr:hypothetical protein FOCG_18230 [Fusarium oxysporum f. sp. radicis-lycopersici 26381]
METYKATSKRQKEIFAEAYKVASEKAFSQENVRRGFQATGIYPVDADRAVAKLKPRERRRPTFQPPTAPPIQIEEGDNIFATPSTSHDIEKLLQRVNWSSENAQRDVRLILRKCGKSLDKRTAATAFQEKEITVQRAKIAALKPSVASIIAILPVMSSKGEKLACESCIRGHRVAQCQHTEQCDCSEGGTCKCAYKSDQRAIDSVLRPMSKSKSSTPSAILSLAEPELGTTDIVPIPLESGCCGNVAPAHNSTESVGTDSVPSRANQSDWLSDDMLDIWTMPSKGSLHDSLPHGTHHWMGTLDSITGVGRNDQAHMTIPTFDDSLLTIDPFGLGDLFSEQPQVEWGHDHADTGQLTMFNNWEPSEFTATNYNYHEQWSNQP